MPTNPMHVSHTRCPLRPRAPAADGTPALIAAVALASATACGTTDPPATGQPPSGAPVAGASPADERAPMPAGVRRYIHSTFHDLPRSCARGRVDEPILDRTTTTFISLHRRYPAARYRVQIDDESGTTLSAILVLRDELTRCSPRHAAAIDAVLPASIRRALRAPRVHR